MIAFILIFSNMFFGHLLFVYDQDINKYSIYVHFQEEWNSYPVNILFDVTNVWSNPNFSNYTYSTDFSNVSDFDNYNSNNLQYQDNRGYVELKHQFSDCNSSWKPMLYRYSILPDIKSINSTVSEFYVQFIPICTDKKITSYEYLISIDDETSWFDVYFVNSKKQLENYLNYNFFNFYTDNDCFGKNYHSFSGICENIDQESGLLIIIPDNLNRSLTKIKVNLHEKI